MTLSIIIPVYNVEQFLNRCIETVYAELHDDDEIILVDDASPDDSGSICDKWAIKDKRIRVLHRAKNGGLSVARNDGIKVAIGSFITFVDSDDYLKPGTLRNNLNLLLENPQADLIEFPVAVHHGTKQAYHYIPGNKNMVTFREWVLQNGHLHCYAWNKIYRRELWNNTVFPKDRYYEDMYTIPYVLERANYILRSDVGTYYYCVNNDSITHIISRERIGDLLTANMDFYHYVQQQKLLPIVKEYEMYLRLCNHQIVYMQLDGLALLSNRHIPFRYIFNMPNLMLKYKALLHYILGSHYCSVMARIRNMLKL